MGGFGPPSNTWSLLSRARCVPKIIPIAEAVWPQYTNVTDRRTDGRISYGIGLDLTVGQKRLEVRLTAKTITITLLPHQAQPISVIVVGVFVVSGAGVQADLGRTTQHERDRRRLSSNQLYGLRRACSSCPMVSKRRTT